MESIYSAEQGLICATSKSTNVGIISLMTNLSNVIRNGVLEAYAHRKESNQPVVCMGR